MDYKFSPLGVFWMQRKPVEQDLVPAQESYHAVTWFS